MNATPMRETAAAWHDRLHREGVPEETRAAFERWLAVSSEHRTAYDAIDQTWFRLQSVAQEPQMLALRQETALRLTRRTCRTVRPLRWAAAAAIVIALGTTLAMLNTHSAGERTPIAWLLDTLRNHGDGRYATATGERLSVTLGDGSQLTLDTQTELKVAFTKAERTVHLSRGQALFEVAKDARRPFIVDAHDRRFIAVGTAFAVRIDGAQIKVTMLEGSVRVERTTSPTAPNATATDEPSRPQGPGTAEIRPARIRPDRMATAAPAVTTLTAGEQLTVDSASEDHVRPADAERVTSWRHGQVIFENTRLADAVAELNRYSDTKIELADPALENLRLSGAFATGHPTVFVEAITAYFPIEITRSDDRALILKARK